MSTEGGPTVPTLAVNGRFLGRPVTGVERYASELLARLPDALGGDVDVLEPRLGSSGPIGHAWEQLILPRVFHRSGADLLLSLCNLGPVSVADQLVVIHDVAPFRLRGTFARVYAARVRWVQRRLARRCHIVTVSRTSRRELASVLDVDPSSVGLVPPGVGPPFTDDVERTPRNRAVLVGGHDRRKNAALLLGIWPRVYARSGMELHIVARSTSDTLQQPVATTGPGVRWHHDLDDRALAALYRSATCVVSPSRYEGFGLPLLEGMACGAPFLATDTGAAAELAVDPDEQLLPVHPAAWTERLCEWSQRDLSRFRRDARERARRWTWDRGAAALARYIRAAVGQRASRSSA